MNQEIIEWIKKIENYPVTTNIIVGFIVLLVASFVAPIVFEKRKNRRQIIKNIKFSRTIVMNLINKMAFLKNELSEFHKNIEEAKKKELARRDLRFYKMKIDFIDMDFPEYELGELELGDTYMINKMSSIIMNIKKINQLMGNLKESFEDIQNMHNENILKAESWLKDNSRNTNGAQQEWYKKITEDHITNLKNIDRIKEIQAYLIKIVRVLYEYEHYSEKRVYGWMRIALNKRFVNVDKRETKIDEKMKEHVDKEMKRFIEH